MAKAKAPAPDPVCRCCGRGRSTIRLRPCEGRVDKRGTFLCFDCRDAMLSACPEGHGLCRTCLTYVRDSAMDASRYQCRRCRNESIAVRNAGMACRKCGNLRSAYARGSVCYSCYSGARTRYGTACAACREPFSVVLRWRSSTLCKACACRLLPTEPSVFLCRECLTTKPWVEARERQYQGRPGVLTICLPCYNRRRVERLSRGALYGRADAVVALAKPHP
jgi:hypothetical protein